MVIFFNLPSKNREICDIRAIDFFGLWEYLCYDSTGGGVYKG